MFFIKIVLIIIDLLVKKERDIFRMKVTIRYCNSWGYTSAAYILKDAIESRIGKELGLTVFIEPAHGSLSAKIQVVLGQGKGLKLIW